MIANTDTNDFSMPQIQIGTAWVPRFGARITLLGVAFIAVLTATLLVLALHAFGQEPGLPIMPPTPPAPPVMAAAPAAPAFDLNLKGIVLQLLPLLLAAIAPYMTSMIRTGVARLASATPGPLMGAMNLVLGTVAAAVAAQVTGGLDPATAIAGGAAMSGVSWKLRQAEPIPQTAVAPPNPGSQP